MTLRDSFTRADGALGSNWTSCGGNAGYTVIGNAAAPSSAQVEEAVFWNPISFANDQFAEATITTVASNAFIGVAVRCSTGSGGSYYGFYADNSTRYLVRVVNGAYTSLATLGTGFANNDVVRLEVTGSTLSAYINGVLWTSTTDTNLTSGSPGLTSWANNTSARLDDFTAADLSTTINFSATVTGTSTTPDTAALLVSRPLSATVTGTSSTPDTIELVHITRPASDVNVNSWTTESGGTSNLYQSIDEVNANDSDYVRSPVSPSASAYRVRLAAMTDPGVYTNVPIRYRLGVDGAGSINWTVRVFNASTEVASWTHSGVSTLTTFEQTLTEVQASALDYSAIDIEWEATLV